MIRASMLPGASDCARRAAARQWPELIIQKGYSLKSTQPSAGARLGDALHMVAAELLRSRAHENIISARTVQNAIDKAWEEFLKKIRTGVVWDKTTRNSNDAAIQLDGMAHSIVATAQRMIPAHIETKLKGSVAGMEDVTGQLDLLELTGLLTDFKTGGREPSPWAQIGCYLLLCEANGIHATDASMVYVPRISASKPQPDAIIRTLDGAEAKLAAEKILVDLQAWLAEFEVTASSWAFPANPMSMMCTPAYCPAYGTDFCKVGKQRGG